MAKAKPARDPKAAKPAKAVKATPAGIRPTAGGRPGVFVQKPRSDIYVALLSIALGAILLGCLLLILHLNAYEFKTKATAIFPADRPQVAALGNFSTVRL